MLKTVVDSARLADFTLVLAVKLRSPSSETNRHALILQFVALGVGIIERLLRRIDLALQALHAIEITIA